MFFFSTALNRPEIGGVKNPKIASSRRISQVRQNWLDHQTQGTVTMSGRTTIHPSPKVRTCVACVLGFVRLTLILWILFLWGSNCNIFSAAKISACVGDSKATQQPSKQKNPWPISAKRFTPLSGHAITLHDS